MRFKTSTLFLYTQNYRRLSGFVCFVAHNSIHVLIMCSHTLQQETHILINDSLEVITSPPGLSWPLCWFRLQILFTTRGFLNLQRTAAVLLRHLEFNLRAATVNIVILVCVYIQRRISFYIYYIIQTQMMKNILCI